MFIFRAKELCPDLVYVPYDFEGYRNVSQTFYEILSSFSFNIEAVSCDEALIDISELVESGKLVCSFLVDVTLKLSFNKAYLCIISFET